MLNVSQNNSIVGKVKTERFRSFSMVKEYRAGRVFSRMLMITFGLIFVLMFFPWTQNIQSRGYVTTLQPNQRPQTIPSVIPGQIKKWYVREGDYVKEGDTILYISEVKDIYFDPELIARLESQIKAKEQSVKSYWEKVTALDNQIDALLNTKDLKLEQTVNYLRQAQFQVQSDSIDYEAAKINYKTAQDQLVRAEDLYKQDLFSLTKLESRRLKLQDEQAKLISKENKLATSRNKLINAKVEFGSVDNQYRDKVAKAESEKASTMSSMFEAEAEVTKMQTTLMNYRLRAGFYYITAPQDGYITEAIRSGVGETVKDGEDLVTLMPAQFEFAVSMFVEPFDLPLIEKGQHVRFMFDGWPTIVFSGWPDMSYGTFGGEVVAIDNFISDNGKYRILVAPDKDEEAWPTGLRVGSGADGMALLKDVPIWYELWRRLNGFPPDYYKTDNKEDKSKKDKK